MKNVSPRKSMAMGDNMPSASAMGIGPIADPDAGAYTHPDRNMETGRSTKDGARGHTPPASSGRAGRMAMPGEVDHGPHSMPAGTNGLRRGK
jgi:hypothetical protein